MEDLISRQAAIDALKNMYRAAEKWCQEAEEELIGARAESCMATLVEIKLRIEKLPSAQPEPIKIQIDHELTHYELVKLRKNLADAPIVLMPSTQEHKIHFADADHVWIDGKQYISLRRFQKAVVEARTERKTGRWIPMTEGPPETRKSILGQKSSKVLVAFRYDDGTQGTDTAHTLNGEWVFDDRITVVARTVTHWMPLPEPPKEEA